MINIHFKEAKKLFNLFFHQYNLELLNFLSEILQIFKNTKIPLRCLINRLDKLFKFLTN